MSAELLAEMTHLYVDDPVGFANDFLDFEPTPQQAEFMESVARNRRTTVRSGHGIGKTRAEGALAWWFMVTRFKPIIAATAPTSHQLYDILWKELIYLKNRLPKAIGDMFDHSSERVWMRQFKEEWYLQAVTSRKENPDALQGFHNEEGGLFFICEEASGIPSVSFEPVEGAITGTDDRMLLCGNPTKTGGYFYDSHNAHKDEYACHVFSSLDSPLYKREVAESLARRYGRTSSIYRVRVLGEFPKAEPDQLIPYETLEDCVMIDTTRHAPILWGVDVARYGDDETCLAKRHGQQFMPVLRKRQADTMEVARWIAAEYRKTPNRFKPISILVDVNGVGAGVFDYLDMKRYPVEPVNAAWAATAPNEFGNARAETYFKFADDLKNRKISLPDVDEHGDPENELLAQGAAIKYILKQAKGGIGGEVMYIESKEEMKKRGFPSPDALEALIHTYYHEYNGSAEEDNDDDFPVHKAQSDDYYDYDEFGGGYDHDHYANNVPVASMEEW